MLTTQRFSVREGIPRTFAASAISALIVFSMRRAALRPFASIVSA
jgi:hypothetical protein